MTFTVQVNHEDDVCRVLPSLGVTPAPQVLGVYRGGRFIGAFVLNHYTGPGGSVHVHWMAAEDGWLTRRLIGWFARHLFDTMKCAVVFGQVRASDHYACRMVERIGFKLFMTIPDYFPNDACALYTLRREDCARWLRNG